MTSSECVAAIQLADVGGALAVCDGDGRVVGATPAARDLLSRLGAALDELPAGLPAALWARIAAHPVGHAVQWRPSGAGHLLLGCTRYSLGLVTWLLVMSEIGHKQ